MAFNTAYVNSNGETVKISKVKYIVSNIVLTKEDGSTYTVPKSQSYFIIDEATEASTLLTLPNIPAGNYTKVKFGICVDQAQFNLGATGQGDFLAQLAEAAGDWQIYFHRGGAWTNAQSSGDLLQPSQPQAPASGASAPAAEAVAATAPREALPEAVRLVITLDGRTLTRDIALGPTGS